MRDTDDAGAALLARVDHLVHATPDVDAAAAARLTVGALLFTLQSTFSLTAAYPGSPPMSESPLKQPSALLPIGMSLAALATVVTHVALVGTAPQPDEGTAAHLWQLLMAAQLPIIGWFALRWLPRVPRRALPVLALQLLAALAALAPVYYFHW